MEIEYSTRLLAFIDILGFKKLIEVNEAKIIAQVLQEMQIDLTESKNKIEFGFSETFELAFFSDSIVISCENSNASGFIDAILDLQIRLMRKGIFIRGCITKGDLYHKGNFIFGQGIIDAYEEESKIAKYPRIILGDNYKYGGTYFCKDYDGILFLDPFRRMNDRKCNDDSFDMHKAIEEINGHIDVNLKKNNQPRDVIMKYSWLQQIINEIFYLDNEEYTYFYPSNSTYDRNDTHKKLRNFLVSQRKEIKESQDNVIDK